MLTDLRYVVRSLIKAKAFSLVTILTLAFGVGASSAIFSVVNRMLFEVSPAADDVYMIGGKSSGEFTPINYSAQIRAYEAKTELFAEIGEASVLLGNVIVGNAPAAILTLGISPNVFPMLGIAPTVGRGFTPGENLAGRNNVVVISDRFRHRHFESSSAALGSTLFIDGVACTIVGVLNPEVVIPKYFQADVYRPLAYKADPAVPWEPTLFAVGRLRHGVTPETAQQSLVATTRELENILPFLAGQVPALTTLSDAQKLFQPNVYWVLLGAVGCLYGVACLNAMHMMLVRLLRNERELGIRLALGAGRFQVVRLLLIEGFVLSIAASAVGILIANWLFPLFVLLGSREVAADWDSWSLNQGSGAFLCAVTLCTCILIVAVPAMRIFRGEIGSRLGSGNWHAGESRGLVRMRSALLVLQAAFAVVLLSGAGLMVRTFDRINHVSLGFEERQGVKIKIGFPQSFGSDGSRRLSALHGLAESLQKVPGVEVVGYGTDVLLPGWFYAGSKVESSRTAETRVAIDYVSPEYLTAAGIRLTRGRLPRSGVRGEVLINEALAKASFGPTNPVGQTIRPLDVATQSEWVVVGVVADIHSQLKATTDYHVFCSDVLNPSLINTFVVRFDQKYSAAVDATIRHAIFEFSPNILVHSTVPLSDLRRREAPLAYIALLIFEILSLAAVVMTVFGTFAILSFTVECRMREFGLRMVLGATEGDLISIVVTRSLFLTLGGVFLGFAAAAELNLSIKGLLFETTPYDPLVLCTVALIMVFAAIIGAALPARRAARVEIASLLSST